MIGSMESLDELKEELGSDYPWTLINAYFAKEHLQQSFVAIIQSLL